MSSANTDEHSAGAPSTGRADLLFIGGVFTKEQEPEILRKSKSTAQLSANALQWNLIAGLDTANSRPVRLLNAVFVGSYPRLYRDAWIPGARWTHADNAGDESVAFLNLFGVKHAWRAAALASRAVRWAVAPSSGPKVIVLYSMHSPFIIAAAAARHVNPQVRTCLIVPDLPEYMSPSGLPRPLALMKAADRVVMDRFLSRVTHFVLLTKHMAGPVGVGSRPWIVMEGCVNPADLAQDDPQLRAARNPAILYTGMLDRAYGISELLEAFAMMKVPDCELWICGRGNAEEDVRRFAERNRRVRYLGQIGRDEVLKLQRQATVLVNPRRDSGEFTRYSFPSKILEYMLSGTPTVANRLPGIPDEYYPYIFTPAGKSPADLAQALTEVCMMSPLERASAAERARRFVLDNKSAAAQGERILRLLDV